MARPAVTAWLAGASGLLAGAAAMWLIVSQQEGAVSNGKERQMARLDYVELPANDLAATRSFYERAFGWQMTQFGPDYAATMTGDTDIGLASDPDDRPQAPLPVIQVSDLDAALESVGKAGGTIVRPIFAFPGGRRFQFKDPSGNEIGVWQTAAE